MKATAQGLAIAVTILLGSSWASAGESKDLEKQLHRLERFIGSGANGQAWKRFLKWEQLEAQLKSESADPLIVAEVLARFRGTEKGLSLPQFAGARKALEAWAATLPPVAPSDLPKLIARAKEGYRPRGTEAAYAQLKTAQAALDRYLSRQEFGDTWVQYLHLEELKQAVNGNQSPDVAKLQELYPKFVSGAEGLELSPMSQLSAALRAYIDAVQTADSDATRKQFQQQLDKLSATVKEFDPQAHNGKGPDVLKALSWLEQAGQAPAVVAAVRKNFSRPNLYVHLDSKFMARAAVQQVDDTSPVRDVILGTDIYGTGHTLGKVELNLIPNDQQAHYELVFGGAVDADSVGYNGPATVYSTSRTTFTSRKQVLLGSRGITALPARTSARVSSHTNGLSTSINVPLLRRVVKNIAWKQVNQKQGQAEAIAARHAESRISSRFNDEVSGKLAEANGKFNKFLVLPMLRRGSRPEQLSFRTTADGMQIVGHYVNRERLAAPWAPPQVKAGAVMSAQLHESSVNNLSDMIAGQTWEDEKAKEMVKELLGKIPEAWQEQDEKGAGTITFADENPVTLLIDNNQVTLTLRAKGFTRGERTYEAMNITAAYKVDKTDGGILATRQGELDILPPNFVKGRRLSLPQTVLRNLLKKTFGKIFTEQIVSHGIEFQGELAKLGKLEVDEFSADDGWVAISWKQADRLAEKPQLKPAAFEKP